MKASSVRGNAKCSPIDAAVGSRQREEGPSQITPRWGGGSGNPCQNLASRRGWPRAGSSVSGANSGLCGSPGRALPDATRPPLQASLSWAPMCEGIVRGPIRRAWNELRAINFLSACSVIAFNMCVTPAYTDYRNGHVPFCYIGPGRRGKIERTFIVLSQDCFKA